MTRGDQRRWATLERIKLQDQLRQFDHSITVLRQHPNLRVRLNALLNERHMVAARLDTAERESAR